MVNHSYFRKTSVLAKYINKEQTTIGDINDSDGYTIFNIVIKSGYIDSRTELILINSQTGIGLLDTSDLERGKPWSLEINDETWNDFSKKNQFPMNLGNSFGLQKPYLIVKYDEMVDINLELWGANVRYTPFLEFSRVGFDRQKNEAIVHVGIALLSRSKPAMRFMTGHYYWLKKVNGAGKIEKTQHTYIT